MSWKRIFRAARRLGMPVIIADESGRNPLVAMSLSKFEDLIEENDVFNASEFEGDESFMDHEDDEMPVELDENFNPIERSLEEIEPEELDPRLEKVFEDQFVHEMEDLAKQKENFIETPSVEPLSEPQESPKTKEEMSLEDRFYFEPLEDEFKK